MWCVLGVLVIATFSVAASAQDFGARVELVRLSVGVYSPDDRVVPKLTAADFRVYDNDELQPIEVFLAPDDTPLIVALVIDASGSMDGAWADVVRAAGQFLAALRPWDCAFVLPFRGRVEAGLWGRPADDWDAFLSGVSPGGGTGMRGALEFAIGTLEANARPPARVPFVARTLPPDPIDLPPPRLSLLTAADLAVARTFDPDAPPPPEPGGCRVGDEPEAPLVLGAPARRAVVLLSDGVAGDVVTPVDEVIRDARAAALPIFTVILGDSGQRGFQQMVAIARETGALVVEARGAPRLFDAFDAVMGFLDATYVLGYRAPRSEPGSGPAGADDVGNDAIGGGNDATRAGNDAAEEWHDVRVELVDRPGLRPLYSAGYAR